MVLLLSYFFFMQLSITLLQFRTGILLPITRYQKKFLTADGMNGINNMRQNALSPCDSGQMTSWHMVFCKQLTSCCVFEYFRIPFSSRKYRCHNRRHTHTQKKMPITVKHRKETNHTLLSANFEGRAAGFSRRFTLCQPFSGYFLLFIK